MTVPPRERPLLVISRNLPPVVGGIERLMHRLVTELARTRACIVIGPRGCRAHLPAGVRVIELPHRPAVVFVALAFLATIAVVLLGRPRAVLAGNGLMSLAALPARLRAVPVATMVYGLDVVAENALYQAICLPLIRASDAVIACSSNTARLARERGVPDARLSALTPGVDPPATAPDPQRVAQLDDGRPTLLSVGRLVPRKGIAGFIRHALPAVVARCPQVRFVVIGSAPAAALQRGESEPARIEAALADTGLRSHVTLAGFVDDRTLAAWMAVARVHVFPVLDLPQDVEGFGLVALEAAAHGVPTVAFDAGGVADAVVAGESGVLVPAGDYAGFAVAVGAYLEASREAIAERCRRVAADRSWARYARAVSEAIEHARAGGETAQRRREP